MYTFDGNQFDIQSHANRSYGIITENKGGQKHASAIR